MRLSYPINLDVEDKICVVVGGGRVAHRKICGLLEAKARVYVIAPELCDELHALLDDRSITWHERSYEAGCLPRGVLMIAATDDPIVNRLAATEAIDKGMLINVVDRSFDGGLRFENPSTIRRGKFMLTISTGGASPALSKLIRQTLENIFDDDFGQRLDEIESMRSTVKHNVEVNIRNALDSYRAQSQDGTD